MTCPALPERIRSREDLEVLLARTTNYEELKPRSTERPVFKLERVRDMLASVGDPHLGPRTVHVAGSKGKGSTARMIEAGLRRAGRSPVGLYTSPHLEDLSERICVDGVPATVDELARAADLLLPHVRRVLGTERQITFFEMLTGIAWLVFREHGCTDVVLETGLGGRLDATSVCAPTLTLITSIELEHTDILGDTVERIAAEKAGILKKAVAAATAARGPAGDVIRARARALGAPLAVLGTDVSVHGVRVTPEPATRARLDFADGADLEIALGVIGAHHADNAALAAWALRALGVPDAAILEAFAALRLPGVVEPLGGDPLVVVDGAHTKVSAEHTRRAVDAAWPGRRRVLLTAMLQGKAPVALADALLPGVVHVVVTRLPTPRTVEEDDLAAAYRARASKDVSVESHADPEAALEAARRAAGAGGLVLATGSVRLAGLVRGMR